MGKITAQQALEAIERRKVAHQAMKEAEQLSFAKLGEKFGIAKETARRLTTASKHRLHGITPDDVALIREAAKERVRLMEIANQHSLRAVADDLGISQTMVKMIESGERLGRLTAG